MGGSLFTRYFKTVMTQPIAARKLLISYTHTAEKTVATSLFAQATALE